MMTHSIIENNESKLISWLLEGDVSIQYQVHRDLLASEQPHLRERIATEGWGAQFLSQRKPEGHWGQRFYQPKWISTHYTLLDLMNLNISPNNQIIRESIFLIIENHKSPEDSTLASISDKSSDMCITGMFLNYASYFGIPQNELRSLIDCLLSHHMADGGFNCRINRSGATHSSMHTTISVLEGLLAYEKTRYKYRLAEVGEVVKESREFLLKHRLYRSDKTGNIIDKKWLMLSYPSRWKYDILRALDYFQSAGINYDPRIQDALDVLKDKRRKDGTWPVQAKHPGQTHFDMEKAGGPSRWNTLRAMRVLKHFGEIE